ncbi:MAG: Hsp70 family protein, partial [Pseudonocardiaceae bacterium]
MSYSVGIDLGITFVAAARATAATVEAVSLSDRSVLAPAVVYLQGDGTLATGEAASRRAVSSPDRIGREFTRLLGDPTPLMLGGQPYAVTELLSVLLRDVVRKITEAEGEPPDRIVLTYPATWGPFRRALFEEAAQQAGLNNPFMVTEPEAAAANYTATRALDDGETVAVYDLGGSTFDATVLRKQPGGVQIIGKPERIERLGGADFDEAILSHVNETTGGALTNLDVRRPQTFVALAGVRQDCTVAKEALSVDTEAAFPVFLPSRSFDVHLTRSDFENMARAPIESTIRVLSRALQSAKVAPADLSAVLLVGGSSRIPLVARMLSAELGCPTVVDTDPQHVVALGAATLASHAAYPRVGRPRNNRAQNNGTQNNGTQNNGTQNNRAQGNGAQGNGAQGNGAPQESRRPDSRGSTAPIPTATLNAVLDTSSPPQSPEHDVQLPIPAQRPADAIPADAIPAQRTPSNGATAATPRHVRPKEPRPPPPAARDRARR